MSQNHLYVCYMFQECILLPKIIKLIIMTIRNKTTLF